MGDTPTSRIVPSGRNTANAEGPPDGADSDKLTEWLSENYRDRLRTFASRRLRDRAAAEDVVQEALQTILGALRANRVREPAAIAAFAFETVRHLCMHRARSHAREGRALERLAVSPAFEPPDILTTVIAEERRRAVRAAFGRLNEEDQRLLVMTYMDLRDSDDIGRELGLSAGAVRVRRYRARQRLAAQLHVTIAAGREHD